MTAQIIVSVCSLIVAAAALTFSIVSFRRQQARAELQARASVKPLLSIRSQNYANLKSIRIVNSGVGPAIIRKAEFRRGADGVATDTIKDLFNLNVPSWEYSVQVVPHRVIPANDEMLLIKLSLDYLDPEHVETEKALGLLDKWRKQKTGIVARVEYEDIYGNEMAVLEETLN